MKILEEKEDSKLGKIIKQLYYNKKIIRNIKWNTQNESKIQKRRILIFHQDL